MFATQASGQATSYDAELMDWDIQISGPNFALQDVALEEYPHGRGERIYVSSVNSLAFAEIAFFDDADTPEETIAVMLAEFESTSQSFSILDQGVANGISYALASFQLSAEFSGYFYIEVAPDVMDNTDVAQSLYTINEDFPLQLSLARDEISIAGNAFLGETAIEIEQQITSHRRSVAATAEATPTETGYSFQTAEVDLQVQQPVAFDYPLRTDNLEAAYISSPVGFGFVGYMQQDAESAREVIELIIADVPAGESKPELLHLQQGREHSWGVYRIPIDGDFTIMMIDVSSVETGLWQIEALAVSESDFLDQLAVFKRSVEVDGRAFLDAVTVEEIDLILIANQP